MRNYYRPGPVRRLLFPFLIAGLILSIPWIAMQFTDEVNWTPFDFAVMGGLFCGVILTGDFILMRIRNRSSRILAMITLLVIAVLVWMELAVGILGTPLAGS